MQNLSDNDIDKLFKQAADQQQPQFDPADWQEMAKRLDTQADAKPAYYYKIWTGAVITLGVAVLLSWLAVDQNQENLIGELGELSSSQNTASISDNKAVTQHPDAFSVVKVDSVEIQQQANELSKVTPSDKTFGEEQPAEKKISTIQKNTTALNANEKSEEVKASGNNIVKSLNPTQKNQSRIVVQKIGNDEKDKTKAKAEPKPKTKTKTMSEANQVLINNPVVVVTNEPKNASVKSSSLSENSGLELLNSAGESENNADKISTRNQALVPNAENKSGEKTDRVVAEQVNSNVVALDRKSASALSANNNSASAQSSSVALIEKDSLKKTLDVKKTDKKLALGTEQRDSIVRKSKLSRLALKVTAAPDFSSDRFKSVDKTGWNYGLMLEYFVAEKFSISAGAIWSRKFYSANEVTYSGYQADRVYGDCRMWDIPVNITYYVSPARSYSLFVTAGASSYLMNEENYEYQVETNYGTYTYSDQILKENKEWFKTMNLSVGLQKQVGRKLALQVEPFIKIPLSGVGEGKIALASFGTFLSLQYKFRTP